MRLELENLEDASARHANPADFARRRIVRDAKEGAHAIRRRIRDADERAAEHFPVKLHGFVEVRHRDTGMAERSCFQALLLADLQVSTTYRSSSCLCSSCLSS